MMKNFSVSGIVFSILFTTAAVAQFTVSGEIRPRAELRDGYKSLAVESSIPAIFISQRSRLNLAYQTEQIRSLISIQDVRIWGDESNYSGTGVTGDPASIDLHEAWFEYSSNPAVRVRIGRQQFKYDDQRLLAARNWNQSGVTYDAVLFNYGKDDFQIDLGLSLNNASENNFGNPYPSGKMKTLDFLYVRKALTDLINLSAIALGTGFTKNNASEVIYMRGTYGSNLVLHTSSTDARAAGYYQNGKNSTGTDVSAYLFSFDVQQDFSFLNLGAGLVYLSGQDAGNADPDYLAKDHCFDILYGTRHGFYGSMDYFNDVASATQNGGLIDMYMNLQFNDNDIVPLISVHLFHLHSDVIMSGATAALDHYLGAELDFGYKYQINSVLDLKGGYSVMLPGESLEMLQGLTPGDSDFSHWAWLMLTFKTTFFQTK